jgi:adenosylhomocysteinase
VVDAAELEWIAWTTPITTSLGAALQGSDFRGRTVACRQHILADTIPILAPFVEAGARVRLASCNADSTDDRAVAHLTSIGVEVRARTGMSAGELDETLAWLVSEPADALCDMGGDLIAAAAAAGHRPAGALEATTTGLHRLEGLQIPFPVLDWNGIALKDLIHNRHHVGVETWPAFSAITGLALYGREVIVVGFGPVGQGVAARARDLGAVVTVVDLDPVRLVQAQHDGCRVAEMAVALRTASVVVTATGFDGVLGEQQLAEVADGAILLNVGHSDREIDVAWLDRHRAAWFDDISSAMSSTVGGSTCSTGAAWSTSRPGSGSALPSCSIPSRRSCSSASTPSSADRPETCRTACSDTRVRWRTAWRERSPPARSDRLILPAAGLAAAGEGPAGLVWGCPVLCVCGEQVTNDASKRSGLPSMSLPVPDTTQEPPGA